MKPRTMILNRRSHSSLYAAGRCLVPLDSIEPYLVTHAYGGVEGLDPAHFRHTYVVDVRDDDQLQNVCRWLIRHEDVTRIVALQEKSILLAAQLRSEFGLAGTDYPTAVRFRDKVLMKQAAQAAGLRTPRFAAITADSDFTDLGWSARRWVLKGRVGEGASDVHIYDSLADCRRSWAELRDSDVRFEVEEFIVGDIYHCDGVWSGGRMTFCATSKYVGRPDEYGPDGFLASYVLPESELTRRMADFTDAVVTALGLRAGVCHLELFRTPADELVLCEVACRPAGGLIAQGLQHSRGVDLVTAVIAAEAGLSGPLIAPATAADGGAVWGWVGVFCRTRGQLPPQRSAWERLGVAEYYEGAAVNRPPAHCTDYAEGYVFHAASEQQWLANLDELVSGVATSPGR